MFELFMAGLFGPWILLFCMIAFFSYSTYNESASVTFLGLLVFFGITWFFYGVNPFSWIISNPLSALLGIGVYCAVGVLWSLFKWRKRLISEPMQLLMSEARARFVTQNPESDPMDYVHSYDFPSKATASYNKDRIVSWIVAWPFSVIGYFVGELLYNLFENIYKLFSGLYDRITKHYAP